MIFKRHKDNAAGAEKAVSDDADMATSQTSRGDVVAPDETTDGNEQENHVRRTASTASEGGTEYPHGLRLALIMVSVFVSMFLVALDRLIISTAIPQITDDFHSLEDVGWYGSAFMLTTCSFQLMFGKLYSFYSVKLVFMCTILVFEAGSAICGAAPSSVVFIIGRAIAGAGSSGIFTGAIVTIVYAIPLHKRPFYQGLFGAVFGLASVAGPLVGGAFTSGVSWRWCFYINLPIGGVALVVIFFMLQVPDRSETKLSWKQKLSQLDALGTLCLLPGVVCLLLALQWGGLTYPWSNGRIIALLVLGGVLLICFVAVQILKPDTATIPPRIFKQRSIMAGFWATICIGSQMMIFVYFLPIWFQAIKDVSAVNSGIRLLPLTLSMVVASMIAGILTGKIGYYTPWMIAGTCILSVGAGMLTTLQLDTGEGKWIGYQVIYGFGLGFTFQAPNMAAQTVLPTKDVPVGTSLMFFSQLLGGAIFISVGQNVLDNQLLTRLSSLQGFNASMIIDSGATNLVNVVPAQLRPTVLTAYNESLRKTFQVGLILACLVIFGSVAMEWRSVKKNKIKDKEAADAEKADAATAREGVVTPAPGEAERAASPERAVQSDDETTVVEGAGSSKRQSGAHFEPESEPNPKSEAPPADVAAADEEGALRETAAAAEPVPVKTTTDDEIHQE